MLPGGGVGGGGGVGVLGGGVGVLIALVSACINADGFFPIPCPGFFNFFCFLLPAVKVVNKYICYSTDYNIR